MSEATRYRAVVAYDGAAYHGFQRQIDGTPTIQAALERTISRVTGQSVSVLGAGRTDTGVHASGQVIAFDAMWQHDEPTLLRALNAELPADIALQTLERAPHGFHPRYDARWREYVYTVIQAEQRQPLHRAQSWHVYGDPLDGAALQAAATLLIGVHNCGALGKPPQGENTVREVVRSTWTHERIGAIDVWRYTVIANAFLQHMVRRIVGGTIAVGQGKLTLDTFTAIFRAARLDARLRLAPPHGLVLTQVQYLV